MKLFESQSPTVDPVPIVISVPHAGTAFPSELARNFKKRLRKHLDDTDWFVHKLYDFAPELGITIIKANLSRWVIDLNRDPESVPLYNDNRLITGICPTTDFFGNRLYKSSDLEPDTKEVEQRLQDYYWPYYRKIEELLAERKEQFGKALLWDAHSIRHLVSTIRQEPFPDMILGDNDEKTADSRVTKTALQGLKSGAFGVNHNAPFKGGHITRYFGKPENGIHGLQLEMNKILYMDDSEVTWNKERASKVKETLQHTIVELIKTMNTL